MTIIGGMDFADQTFELVSRQEQSRTAYGRTIVKDLGSALWVATYTTWPIPNADSLAYEAQLHVLDGSVGVFDAWDLRREYPRIGSSWNDGVLSSVNADNKHLSLSGLASGQVLSPGDYLSFGTALHQVIVGATASGGGATVEVRPHIRPGFTIGGAVKVRQPRVSFAIVPGSMSVKANGALHTVITFQAMQAI